VFGFTGATACWWDEVARLRAGGDLNATLSSEFDLLRYEQRFPELHARLAAASSEFAQHSAFGARVGASQKPVAELVGWERLLAGDANAATRAGEALEIFVDRLPKSTRSEWWRRLLAGESALMRGEQARATDEARAATRLVAETSTPPESLHVRLMAARVLAWAGNDDEAIALLETLARGYPGVGPATIARDPFFRTRLSANPRWRALEQALNVELAANQALLTTPPCAQ
jgi:TolA-binding protein